MTAFNPITLMRSCLSLCLFFSVLTPLFAQSDRYKLTEKDTVITCALTNRSTVAGPFTDGHSADFENLVTSVFKASPFPPQPYTVLKMKGEGDLRIGKHTYDDLDYHTFLLYNIDSVAQFNYKARTKYGLMAVLAHEAGHHALHHFMPKLKKSIMHQELQADYFAGWLLAKFGVPQADVAKGIAAVSDASAANYPVTKDRVSATQLGFTVGSLPRETSPLVMLETGKTVSADWLKKWSRIVPTSEGASLQDHTFAKDVPELILDGQGQLIYADKGKNFVIARAVPSKDQRFGYILFDNQFNYWWIMKDGSITTADQSKTLAQVNTGVLVEGE